MAFGAVQFTCAWPDAGVALTPVGVLGAVGEPAPEPGANSTSTQ